MVVDKVVHGRGVDVVDVDQVHPAERVRVRELGKVALGRAGLARQMGGAERRQGGDCRHWGAGWIWCGGFRHWRDAVVFQKFHHLNLQGND